MTDKRLEKISELEYARVVYEAEEAELVKQFEDGKWEAKANIRRLVREAREVGVPYRQIGFALQTSDHATLKNYEKDIRR